PDCSAYLPDLHSFPTRRSSDLLQVLPASEVPVVEAHISGCAECRREMEALRPIIAGFVSWPTDVLRPSTSLWERLARRIAAETGDRKSTRLNSSHVAISYAVFC